MDIDKVSMGKETGNSIIPELEKVAQVADEHVLNRPSTFLQQLKERRKGIVTGVCMVGCMVAGVLLVSAFIGAHYNSIPPRDVFNPVAYGGLAGGYFGYLIAKVLNRS